MQLENKEHFYKAWLSFSFCLAALFKWFDNQTNWDLIRIYNDNQWKEKSTKIKRQRKVISMGNIEKLHTSIYLIYLLLCSLSDSTIIKMQSRNMRWQSMI